MLLEKILLSDLDRLLPQEASATIYRQRN